MPKKKKGDKSYRRRQPLSKREKYTNLTDKERLKITQMRDMGFTLKEITNEIGCSFATTRYTLKNWAPANLPEVKKARAEALEEFAGKLFRKSSEALDYITPDSMTHDRVEVRDEDGRLTEVKHSGPTGFQNSNIVGHLIERATKLQELALNLRGESTSTGPSGIEDVGKLLESIGSRAKRLNIDIQLDELKEAVEADFEEVAEDGVVEE